MKILYDYQILMIQRYGGISRYFFELISRINKKKGYSAKIDCLGSMNHYFQDYFNKEARKAELSGFYKKFIRQLNKFRTIINSKGNYDIVHPTYYDPYLRKYIKGRYVLTVYDMIQEIFPESFPEHARSSKKECILSADHIIAISESTKRDILNFFPELSPEMITVIYIGSNMSKVDDSELQQSFPSKYVLFVGERKSYKNFANFSIAMDSILDVDDSLHVVCTGGRAFKQEELKVLGNKANRYHQINCNDDLLAAAYMNAECFVFPSKYEGFGIPVLEAFACDCPVVLSNTSSLPEVGGDAVEYCDPNDVSSIHDAIEKVLTSPELREELILKGREQRKKFDWNVITEQTLECYRKVIKAHESQKQDSDN